MGKEKANIPLFIMGLIASISALLTMIFGSDTIFLTIAIYATIGAVFIKWVLPTLTKLLK